MEKKTTPKWLKDIQENSWNPELLISGLSLVSIFTLSSAVNDFLIRIVIEHDVVPIVVYLGGLYLNFALISLKIAFILHLILRGIWIGFVGLQYAFPEGIRFDKLPNANRIPAIAKEIRQPEELILLLERICSSIFSFAFSFVGLSVFIILLIGVVLLLSFIGLPLVITIGCLFGFLILQGIMSSMYPWLLKKTGKEEIKVIKYILLGFSRLTRNFFFGESLLVYASNINSRIVGVILMVYSMAMGLSGAMASDRLIQFSKEMQPSYAVIEKIREFKQGGKPRKEEPAVLKSNYYADQKAPGNLVEKVVIPSKKVSNYIELQVVDYKRDIDVFDLVNTDSTLAYRIDPLVELYIDSVQVEAPVWYWSFYAETDQSTWLTMVDVQALAPGPHTLRIDKKIITLDTEELIEFEGWAVVPFWKE